jgi:hypothetical protein
VELERISQSAIQTVAMPELLETLPNVSIVHQIVQAHVQHDVDLARAVLHPTILQFLPGG